MNRIESVFGPIKYKYAKGDDACQILGRLKDSQPLTDMGGNVESEVDCLFLIDRGVDMISPFCINQTYEGLLDETFKIKTQTITVDVTLVKPEAYKDPKNPPPSPNVMLLLTNEDIVFKEVRNKHFTSLEKIFSKKL